MEQQDRSKKKGKNHCFENTNTSYYSLKILTIKLYNYKKLAFILKKAQTDFFR